MATAPAHPTTWTDLGQAWLAWQIALLQGNRLPLSGDVTQWIRTWGEIVGQVGLFNVNIAGSTDPLAEKRIGAEYSYGRQLGRIMEVLTPHLKRHESDFAGPQDQAALKDYFAMAEAIAQLKARRCSTEQVVALVAKWQDDPDFDAQRDELIRQLSALRPSPASAG